MKTIALSDPKAEAAYTAYIHRVKRMLKTLPLEDQEDMLMEINSHIYEHLQQNSSSGTEYEHIRAILEKLGSPEETLTAWVADKKLRQAARSGNPLHIAKALSLNLFNGITNMICGLLYLLLLGFLVCMLAKPFFPDHVGLFVDGERIKAIGLLANHHAYEEVLGFRFIPLMMALSAATYGIITLLLKLKYKK
jgi:hypothetical protein